MRLDGSPLQTRVQRARQPPLNVIRLLFTLIIAVLRSAVSAFVDFGAIFLSSALALAVVALVAVGLTGIITVRISRRRARTQNGA